MFIVGHTDNKDEHKDHDPRNMQLAFWCFPYKLFFPVCAYFFTLQIYSNGEFLNLWLKM